MVACPMHPDGCPDSLELRLPLAGEACQVGRELQPDEPVPPCLLPAEAALVVSHTESYALCRMHGESLMGYLAQYVRREQ